MQKMHINCFASPGCYTDMYTLYPYMCNRHAFVTTCNYMVGGADPEYFFKVGYRLGFAFVSFTASED